MTLTNPVTFYAIIALVALLFVALVLVVILLVRKLRKLQTHLYNDELELSAKIEF
ncbi:MAG: hypothetical protein KAQ68_10060 [Clostridiales bacterium]|nr:hypothetical protein [Clostridiales bacterium]